MGKNIFRKLVDSLFDEVVVEEELDDEELEEVILPPVSNVVLPQETKKVTVKEEVSEPIRKEVLQKETRSNMISVDDLKEAPVSIKKMTPERKAKPEYEFTRVISPIFGVMNEPEEKEDAFLPNTQRKKKPAKPNSVLGTVISPIYGIGKEEEEAVNMDYDLSEDNESFTLDELIETKKEPVTVPTSNQSEEGVDLFHQEANFDSLVHSFQEDDHIQQESTKRVMDGYNLSLFDDEDEDIK